MTLNQTDRTVIRVLQHAPVPMSCKGLALATAIDREQVYKSLAKLTKAGSIRNRKYDRPGVNFFAAPGEYVLVRTPAENN
jgi:predicted transcriptional regulator